MRCIRNCNSFALSNKVILAIASAEMRSLEELSRAEEGMLLELISSGVADSLSTALRATQREADAVQRELQISSASLAHCSKT